MKATIYFTEKHIEIFSEDHCVVSTNILRSDTNKEFSQSRAELEKLRLEAVIQKEAEEMYPFEKINSYQNGDINWYAYFEKTKKFNDKQGGFQIEYISWLQSLLSRLPSEEEICGEAWETDAEKDENGFFKYKYAFGDDEQEAFIKGANWLKSKLLPSLPSTLSCEYEEENGKIEIKKLWI